MTLQRIRRAVSFLEKKLGVPRPLATDRMLTDGRDILVEWCGAWLNATEEGQLEFRTVLDAYLKRIEFDRTGMPRRLSPFASRALGAAPAILEASLAIVIDPCVQFGRPCLRGTGIPTSEIASRHKGGESIASIAEDYGRRVEEIEEAIRYELAA